MCAIDVSLIAPYQIQIGYIAKQSFDIIGVIQIKYLYRVLSNRQMALYRLYLLCKVYFRSIITQPTTRISFLEIDSVYNGIAIERDKKSKWFDYLKTRNFLEWETRSMVTYRSSLMRQQSNHSKEFKQKKIPSLVLLAPSTFHLDFNIGC